MNLNGRKHPSGIPVKGERWLFFQTEIPADKLESTGEQKITNKAIVSKGQESVLDNGIMQSEKKSKFPMYHDLLTCGLDS